MDLQKTQVFQRKRWNPSDSSVTTLPYIRHKSRARQLKSPVTSQPGLSLPPPMNILSGSSLPDSINYEQYNRIAHESRTINFRFAESRAKNDQRTSVQNPLNCMPTRDLIMNPLIKRNNMTQNRQITTPISHLNIYSLTEQSRSVPEQSGKGNSGLKFKIQLDKTSNGQIKGYSIKEQPEQLQRLRIKESMLDVYVLEMKEKGIGYRKEVKELEEERQKLLKERQNVTKGCHSKELRWVLQSRQKLRKMQEQIALATVDKQSQKNVIWSLKDNYFKMRKNCSEALEKLPTNVRNFIETKQLTQIETKLVKIDKVVQIKRETLVNLEVDMLRIQRQKNQLNKQRTEVLLKLATKH